MCVCIPCLLLQGLALLTLFSAAVACGSLSYFILFYFILLGKTFLFLLFVLFYRILLLGIIIIYAPSKISTSSHTHRDRERGGEGEKLKECVCKFAFYILQRHLRHR